MERKRETLNTRIKPSILDRLRSFAKKINKSQADIVEEALTEYMDKK
jgi:predicted DNA-binding protein